MNIPRSLKTLTATVLLLAGFFASATSANTSQNSVVTVAGGCFWCVESDFESVEGVENAISGYAGGTTANPTYKQVTKGGTGHYEAVEIHFDPSTVTMENLFSLFFRSIDPTDSGGQFCDRGESYRTAIFVKDNSERMIAENAKREAEAALGQMIVTPILDAGEFYKAEEYHQDYYRGKKLVLTRFGPKKQSEAYKAYRKACGRDDRVRQLWGSEAVFASNH